MNAWEVLAASFLLPQIGSPFPVLSCSNVDIYVVYIITCFLEK